MERVLDGLDHITVFLVYDPTISLIVELVEERQKWVGTVRASRLPTVSVRLMVAAASVLSSAGSGVGAARTT